MILMLDKKLPLIIQEFIELEYDIRVIVVLHDKVIGVMKRNVIKGSDFRSNVSLGVRIRKNGTNRIRKNSS